MHLETARKSASDRSAPVASFMVSDDATFKPMPPPRGQRREPEGTLVPAARSFGSFSAAGQKMNINSLTSARCARPGIGEKIPLKIVFRKVLSSSVTRKLVPPSPLGKANNPAALWPDGYKRAKTF